MSLNVWVFNHFASTPYTNTGAGERFYYLADYFAKNGWDTTVFSASYSHLFLRQPKRKFPYSVEDHHGFKFLWVWVTKYNPSSGIQRLINWLSFVFSLFIINKRKLKKPDVIIVSSMSIWPILNALWIRKFHRNVKVVFEIRDVWPLTPIHIGGISKSNPVIRIMFWLEKLAYSKADHLVSVLPNADLRFKEVLGHEDFKFSWIPNALEHTSFSEPSLSTQENQSSNFKVMYAGAIGPANNLSFLLDAVQMMADRDVEFTIVGDGPEREDLQLKAKGLKVKFTGKVPKPEVHEILSEADLLFIAWRDIDLYKFGVSANKYNDYMKLSKPILSAGNLPFDPVILANCGVVAKPNSGDEIANGILQIMALSPQERAQLGANGYEYFIKNKTYDVISKKYIGLINSLSNV
jgi:glycosyltransferase involved in cell wall biosynthesis